MVPSAPAAEEERRGPVDPGAEGQRRRHELGFEAVHIPYAEQTIRNLMSRGVFRLGEHYLKPRSRIMFRWSKVREWLEEQPVIR